MNKSLSRIAFNTVFAISMVVIFMIVLLYLWGVATGQVITKSDILKSPNEILLEQYTQFEHDCLATEKYTKDQCLLIWSGKE